MTDPTPEMEPAFDTHDIRALLQDFGEIARDAASAAIRMREVVSVLATEEDVPIQMVTAAVKLAENYVGVSEQTLQMQSNFTRWLDAIDGKHVAEEAGGADGLGA